MDKLIKKSFEDRMTHTTLNLCIGDRDAYNKYIKKQHPEHNDIPDTADGCHTWITTENYTYRYVRLLKMDFPILVHELLHFTLRACHSKGIPYEPGYDETAAMMITYFFEEILRWYKKNKKKVDMI